jgi:hypothetical protein
MYNTEPNPIQNKKFAYHTYDDFTQYSKETLKLLINCACYINGEYKEVDTKITDDDIPEIVDNLTTQSATSTLSANQGYVLK